MITAQGIQDLFLEVNIITTIAQAEEQKMCYHATVDGMTFEEGITYCQSNNMTLQMAKTPDKLSELIEELQE